MTEQQVATPVVPVTPEPGSRLEQLHAQYADAKAQADESAARLKSITDGIKAELSAMAPDARRIALGGSAGPALAMTYTESWRLDSKRLKADAPETYVRYAKQSASWTLREAPQQGGE